MKLFMICAVLVLTIAVTPLTLSASEKHTGQSAAKNAGFEKIKALCGDWEIVHGSGEHGMPSGTISYKSTAGGAAIVESTFQGSPHEMVTMYYVDGDGGLCLTHYCVLGNRPHMRALPQSSTDQIVFKCRPEDNVGLDSEDHMHQATFTFLDPDHVKAEWVLYHAGKPAGAHAFTLARKKK